MYLEKGNNYNSAYWTLELASKLEDAPWPATKEELIDYAMRSGACNRQKTKVMCMSALKTSGPTIQAKKISSLTKKSTKLHSF